MRKKIVKVASLHPFLFAVYPVIFLFLQNISKIYFSNILFPLSLAILGGSVIWLLTWLLFRNWSKAAILTSLFITLFSFYGYIYITLVKRNIFGLLKVNHALLIIFSVGVMIFAFIKLRKSSLEVDAKVNKIFLFVVVMLLGLATVNLAIHREHSTNQIMREGGNTIPLSKEAASMPDIYYIILDAYGNQTTFKDIYGYENTDFLDYLKSKGFFIATKSRTNYPITYLSLASSLNMNYIQSLVSIDTASHPHIWSSAGELIENNVVARSLKEIGYEYYVFSSGLILANKPKIADKFYTNVWANEFIMKLIENSVLSIFRNKLLRDNWRNSILYTFSKLESFKVDSKPKFIFAHILLPHHPYVFKANGDPGSWSPWVGEGEKGGHWMYHEEYIEQLKFTNIKVKSLIDSILARSKKPPIIILQGDHGPDLTFGEYPGGGSWGAPNKINLQERMRTFNAYYLPDKANSILYDSITPVNTFRRIFNHYFNTTLPYLDDQSFFAPYSKLYKLENVTDSAKFN